MIDIGTTRFLINVPGFPRHEFEDYSTRLFEEWEHQVHRTLILPDYFLALEIEEGSLKGRGKIAVALGALYVGIGQYSDFVSGIQTIRGQVSTAGDFLTEHAIMPFRHGHKMAQIRKNGGSLANLERLFIKVQRQEMTVEQAMCEAEKLLGDEAATTPEFMQQLYASLRNAPLLPQQLQLLPDEPEHDSTVPPGGTDRRTRSTEPRPSLPPPERMRVEVWRESKKGKRKVRVIQL